ncbi:cyclic nucleotide-binding domain-containing protein [Thioalkalivibrio sp.]|uniref:cyclic nucleotide-binding domain-containing protein n=1 Tax=Thioalkalivibrio sp. TaxID=2093813 RepID=UPI0035675D06
MWNAAEPVIGTVDLLKQTEFFSDLDAEQLERIAGVSRRERIELGAEIYHLGQRPENFYVLIDGVVRFTVGHGVRQASVGEIIHRGQVIGWAALIEGAPKRTATAVCLTGCSVLTLPGQDVLALMDQDVRMGYFILKRLTRLVNGQLTAFAAG